MNRNYCLICKFSICPDDKKYNIELHKTTGSNTLLREFINHLLDNRIKYTTLNICFVCYNLVNDLDIAQKKAADIRKKLLCYLNNEIEFYSNLPKIQPELMQQPEDESLMDDISFEIENIFSDSNDELLNETVHSSKSLYNESTKETEEKSKKLFECLECKEKFKTKEELKTHLSTHSNTKPFICEICGQSYKNKSGFDTHMGMHKGLYPFKCPHCNKAFTQKGSLQRHLPMHTGETPFQCDQCGKRFIHHSSFKIHQMHHSGQKDFKCPICDLALMTGSHLRRHMKVHTGEKRFNCEICGRRFAERYNYSVHQKVHEKHGINNPIKRNRCKKDADENTTSNYDDSLDKGIEEKSVSNVKLKELKPIENTIQNTNTPQHEAINKSAALEEQKQPHLLKDNHTQETQFQQTQHDYMDIRFLEEQNRQNMSIHSQQIFFDSSELPAASVFSNVTVPENNQKLTSTVPLLVAPNITYHWTYNT